MILLLLLTGSLCPPQFAFAELYIIAGVKKDQEQWTCNRKEGVLNENLTKLVDNADGRNANFQSIRILRKCTALDTHFEYILSRLRFHFRQPSPARTRTRAERLETQQV